jgi:hypothetical protein
MLRLGGDVGASFLSARVGGCLFRVLLEAGIGRYVFMREYRGL